MHVSVWCLMTCPHKELILCLIRIPCCVVFYPLWRKFPVDVVGHFTFVLLLHVFIIYIRSKNWRSTFNSFMVDTMIYYNTPLSQFLFDLVLCWCVFDLTRYDCMVLNTLDSMTGAWSQKMKISLPGHLFTHLVFPECLCCLECDIYSWLCYVYKWTNGGR